MRTSLYVGDVVVVVIIVDDDGEFALVGDFSGSFNLLAIPIWVAPRRGEERGHA
jgi:hypothetical protein